MGQPKLFLARFLLCVWAVLFAAFLSLILFEARGGGVDSPMAGVYLDAEPAPIHLPNRLFTCTELAQRTQCQAEIEGRSLVLNLTSDGDSNPIFSNCRAQYDGQPVTCTSQTLDYAPALSNSFELDTLGLSPQQLQRIRRRYWSVNTLLAAGEPKLLRVSLGLSIAAGALASFWTWFYPSWVSKGCAAIAWGFVAYRLTWMKLASVPFDAVTPYGLTEAIWLRVAEGGAVIAGGMALLAMIWLLRRGQHRAVRAIVTLSTGVGAMLITGFTLMLVLLWSGFAD